MSKFEEDFHIQHFKDEPLQVRIMDYDTYSANDAIGKVCQCDIWQRAYWHFGTQVYIDLNPLLLPQPGSRPIPGTDVSVSSSVKVGSSRAGVVAKISTQ